MLLKVNLRVSRNWMCHHIIISPSRIYYTIGMYPFLLLMTMTWLLPDLDQDDRMVFISDHDQLTLTQHFFANIHIIFYAAIAKSNAMLICVSIFDIVVTC